MSVVNLLILGVVIGANNLATAMALGALGQRERRWRVIAIFGAFEFTVPLVGLWLGQRATTWLVDHTSWLSVLLLVGLGVASLVAAARYRPHETAIADRITSIGGTMLLGAGLSLDNLIVGFTLGLRDARPLVIAATISIFSMSFTWLGMTLGDHGRRHWERYAEAFAGLLLIALGIAAGLGWF